MDISGSERYRRRSTWLESCGERRRKGNGLLEMVSGRRKESKRTKTREKGLVAGTTCTYTGVRRGRTRARRRKRAKWDVEGICRNHQDSIEFAGALVRISNTDRIQGIFLSVSTQPMSVSDPRMMTGQCTGRTRTAVAEWSDWERSYYPFRWLKVFTGVKYASVYVSEREAK